MQQTGIFIITGMCMLVLFLVAYRRKLEFIINFILRSVVGMVAVYIINHVLSTQEIGVQVGINLVSLLTSGTLGIPGVVLLYSVQLYHFL